MNMRGLDIPFVRMGAVTTEDLFEDREQEIFDFYEAHASRYRRAVDIGANVGIHSILMAHNGWEVVSYEPDQEHFAHLKINALANDAKIRAVCAAVSIVDGEGLFVRVHGNGTANHLAGSRLFYGGADKVRVPTVDCRPVFEWADFAKIDCEGHEAAILLASPTDIECEFMVEVQDAMNARAIFNHYAGKREMWSQRGGWLPVENLQDMPSHYTDGAVFIGEDPCNR